MDKQVVIDVSTLYDKTAKITELENYVNKARRLIYHSPVTGKVMIFDHSPL